MLNVYNKINKVLLINPNFNLLIVKFEVETNPLTNLEFLVVVHDFPKSYS